MVTFLHDIEDELLADLKGLPEVREAAREEPHTARLLLTSDVVPLEAITDISRARKNKARSISLVEPTLEDVFLHYTGRGLRDEATESYHYAIPSMMR